MVETTAGGLSPCGGWGLPQQGDSPPVVVSTSLTTSRPSGPSFGIGQPAYAPAQQRTRAQVREAHGPRVAPQVRVRAKSQAIHRDVPPVAHHGLQHAEHVLLRHILPARAVVAHHPVRAIAVHAQHAMQHVRPAPLDARASKQDDVQPAAASPLAAATPRTASSSPKSKRAYARSRDSPKTASR